MSISDDSIFFYEHNTDYLNNKTNELCIEIPKGILEGTPDFTAMINEKYVQGTRIHKLHKVSDKIKNKNASCECIDGYEK